MTGVQQRTVHSDDDGIRLDRWFKRHFPDLTFGALSKLARTGQIRLDGKRVKPGDRVSKGQTVRIPPLDDTPAPRSEAKPNTIRPEDAEMIRNTVIHRDADVIVLNKPPGLATQGGTGLSRHVDGLLDALKFDAPDRPKLVHRLDKDTSGVLVLARNAKAAAALTKAFRARDTEKIYWALVKGVPKTRQGKIDAAIEKLPGARGERMVASEDGKSAVSFYAVIDQAAQKAAWLALSPLTGRTHQLRVHSALIGHPIIGDGKYGGEEAVIGGIVSRKLHLHARSLAIAHPRGGTLQVTAGLPRHMAASWDLFGWDKHDRQDPFEEAM